MSAASIAAVTDYAALPVCDWCQAALGDDHDHPAQWDPDLCDTSYHEAGHAVMRMFLGLDFERIEIRRDGSDGSLGEVMIRESRPIPSWQWALIHAAGPIAEGVHERTKLEHFELLRMLAGEPPADMVQMFHHSAETSHTELAEALEVGVDITGCLGIVLHQWQAVHDLAQALLGSEDPLGYAAARRAAGFTDMGATR